MGLNLFLINITYIQTHKDDLNDWKSASGYVRDWNKAQGSSNSPGHTSTLTNLCEIPGI